MRSGQKQKKNETNVWHKEKCTNEWGRDGHGQTSNGSMFFAVVGWVTNDYLKGKEGKEKGKKAAT